MGREYTVLCTYVAMYTVNREGLGATALSKRIPSNINAPGISCCFFSVTCTNL